MAGVADNANRTAKAAANLIQILCIPCSIADFVAQTRIFISNELFQNATGAKVATKDPHLDCS